MSGDILDELFDSCDPFDDPAWQRTELMAGAPPRPAKGYVTCSLAWLARVRPLISSADQILVLLLLYRQCLLRRSKTVNLSNHELSKLGITRQTKYRALQTLQEVGAATIESRNGRSIEVTLHWFP